MSGRYLLEIYTKHFTRVFCRRELINVGYCWLWALGAHRLIGGELCRTQIEENHAWVMLDGRHYDSDHPRGVKDVQRLDQVDIGRRFCGETGYHHWWTAAAFLRHWGVARFTRNRRRQLAEVVRATRKELGDVERKELQDEELQRALDGSLQMEAGGH